MTTTEQQARPEPPSRKDVGRYWLAVMHNQLEPGSVEVPDHPDNPPPQLDLEGEF